ncbi:hypothetical protein VTJ83DRAFT_6021 [Remersonia thermophila]|uniref:Ankyrin repeat protein n=1 Tax=Remersonia thermophila TaxID=72144 RepID=A0ABR4DAN6_9PEZI
MSTPAPTSENFDGFPVLDGQDVQPGADLAAQNGQTAKGKEKDNDATRAAQPSAPSVVVAAASARTAQPGFETQDRHRTALEAPKMDFLTIPSPLHERSLTSKSEPANTGLLEIPIGPQDRVLTTQSDMPRTGRSDIAGQLQAKLGTGDVRGPEGLARRAPRLAKWGLSRTPADAKLASPRPSEQQGQGNDKAAKKAGPPRPPHEVPKIESDLKVVYAPDLVSSASPRVDIVAIHDIDETLTKAWIYRKKQKRRTPDPRDGRVPHASAGINSHDGEHGLGIAGSSVPGRSKSKQSSVPTSKKKPAYEPAKSIQEWLDGHESDLANINSTDIPAYDSGPSHQPVTAVEEPEESPWPTMLGSVPEDEDFSPTAELSDDVRRRRMRRKPTLDKKKPGNRFSAIIEDEIVSSVGRANADVLSVGRQSSVDQAFEKRVNWLSDLDMLPSEIRGARVMCYTYKGDEQVADPWEYLTKLAKDMINRLTQKRHSDTADYGRVPIVFVGHGFGALIVQRAMIRLIVETREKLKETTGFLKVAGLILLDAPAPGSLKEFPQSRSQEGKKTWTEDWLRKHNTPGAPSHKIDTLAMWSRLSLTLSAYFVPVLWHYYSATAVAAKNSEVMLAVRQSPTSHRLSRFEGPTDVDYRTIIKSIKRSLVVLTSTTKSEDLASCLAGFLKDKFPVDLRDQKGYTALHLAVRAGNPDAVKRLLYQGKASPVLKDMQGRSALNLAIQEAAQCTRACNGKIDPDQEKIYTEIITHLMKNGSRVDDKDNDGRNPWSYAEGHGTDWIRRLKDRQPILGSSSKSSLGPPVVSPPRSSAQKKACHDYEVILAEVFLQKNQGRFYDLFNLKLVPVYEAIYRAKPNALQRLENSRHKHLSADNVRCRWIHVPANNEQWIHDLMLSMRIEDGSMGGQRHEGSQLIDRYMTPQARRYKHFRTVEAGKARTEPRPNSRPTRFGGSSRNDNLAPEPDDVLQKGWKTGKAIISPDVNLGRTEADAIVIFMPILGFERHRHRKYLTHAFLEAIDAMCARNGLPDSNGRVKAGSPNPFVLDSSDDAQSDDENGTSQLYPASTPVVHAHRDARQGRDVALLKGYLDTTRPVHCRRTLDQFSYYMLSSTEARDKSQVGYRWAKDPNICPEPKNRPIVMVDQLWAWVLHDGTIITSSPSTWDGQEDFNLSAVLLQELQRNKNRPVLKSAEDLLHLILRSSVDFFRRKGPVNFQFQECFQSSINNVSEKQGQLFDNFRRTTKLLQRDTLDPQERKSQIDTLFSLDEETELLVEIMDIQDELTIVKNVLTQQRDVLTQLLRLYPKGFDEGAEEDGAEARPGASLGKGELLVLQSLVQLLRDQTDPVNPSFQGTTQGGSESKGKGSVGETLWQTPTPHGAAGTRTNVLQNRDLMFETIGIVENNMRVVRDMITYAEKVESSLENLLDLKQKHANGWEARFAREGSEESQRQGNIILVFTLVTVVFLPLSFITSFLALEIDIFPKSEETQENHWPLVDVSGYLFGISAAIFIPLIVLALYVNKLIARVKYFYLQALSAISNPDTALNPLPDKAETDHDSDLENTFVGAPSVTHCSSRYGSNKRSDRTTHAKSGPPTSYRRHRHHHSSSDSESDGSIESGSTRRYAMLFGYFVFHTNLPWIRNLWLYRQYRVSDARKGNNRWKDSYVADYPLRRFRRRVRLWVLRGLVITLALCGSRKHKKAVERDRRRKKKLQERRTREDMGGEGNMSMTSDSHASGSGSEEEEKEGKGRNGRLSGREKVDRRDFARGLVVNREKGVVKRRSKKGSRASPWPRSSWAAAGSHATEWSGTGREDADGRFSRAAGSLPERWSNDPGARRSLDWGGGDDLNRRNSFEFDPRVGGETGESQKKMDRRERLSWLRLRRNMGGRERGELVDEEKVIGETTRKGEKGPRVTVDEIH